MFFSYLFTVSQLLHDTTNHCILYRNNYYLKPAVTITTASETTT
jgi:hypothetical protein